MVASYAGAEAAIRSRLVAAWTTTRITFQNEEPDAPWPPVDGSNNLLPWVHLEINSDGNRVIGQGTPGALTWQKQGVIAVHVFVPRGVGTGLAVGYADAIGEIFRAAKFYDGVTAGCYVRTWAPDVDSGGSASDDGNWYRVTMTVDFEYWHRG